MGEVFIADSVASAVTGGTMDCLTVCGGALYNASTAVLQGVTLESNQATLDGGAIHNTGTLTLENATFSGNATSTGTGAAVSNIGTATLTHTTIAANTTGAGGAIGVTAGTLTLTESIVANNSGGNCAGTVTDGGYNISYPDSTCPGLNQDPLLDPAGLQDNGGSTPTIDLLPGSPAIDLIPIASCTLSTDQRGVTRPQQAGCDAGAVEWVDTVDAQFADLAAAIGALPIQAGTGTAASIRRILLTMVSIAQWLDANGQDALACTMLLRLDLEIQTQVAKRRVSPADADDIFARTAQLRTSLGC